MPEPRTAFDVLEVSREATDREIEAAYKTRVIEAEIAGRAVPDDVEAAYYALREPLNRSKYQELLKRVAKRRAIHVPPAQCQGFHEFCANAHILSQEHPVGSHCYYVWLKGQDPPYPVQRSDGGSRPAAPGSALTFGYAFGYVVRQLLCFRLFRTSGPFVRFLLLAFYAFVAVELWLAGSQVVEAWKIRNARIVQERQAVERQELQRTLVEQCGAASSALADLDRAIAAMKSDFEKTTGVPFLDAVSLKTSRPAEVDTALLRHETVREAWSAITHSPPSPADLARWQESLAQIVERVRNRYERPDDKQELERVITWAREKADLIRRQKSSIEHIRVMLAADRFEESMQPEERSPQK